MASTAHESATGGENGRLAAWQLWCVLAMACAAWLPGLVALPALDRDESRFAQASRQMVESGNYLDIRLGNAPRYNKPIGIYWLQAATARAAEFVGRSLPQRIWIYRLPSFISGVLCLILVFSCVRDFASRETALIAAALLGLSLLLSAESEIATTDAALLACIIAAQMSLLRIRIAQAEHKSLSARTALTGWAAVGAGVLIKGPVILAVLVATIVAVSVWSRDWRWFKATRPLPGVLVAAAIVVPWAIAIGVVSHGAFFQQSIGHDFAAKIAEGQESHGAPPGYYLALSSFTLWPATLFLIPSLGMAWRRRTEPAVQFFICWALSSFLLFELVPTKLPHYILPAFPALAAMAALWTANPQLPAPTRWQRILPYLSSLQFAAGTIALVIVSFVLPARFDGASPWWVLVAAVLGMTAGGAAIVFLLIGRRMAALATVAICSVVIYSALTVGVAPQLKKLWISEHAAALVARYGHPQDPPLVSAGYAEPSLLFDLGANTKFSTGEGAANICAGQGGLALVEDHERGPFLHRLSELKAVASPLDRFWGFDYSRGRNESFTFYRVDQVPLDSGPRRG